MVVSVLTSGMLRSLTMPHCALELVMYGIGMIDLLVILGLPLSSVDQHVSSLHWSMRKGRVVSVHQSNLAHVLAILFNGLIVLFVSFRLHTHTLGRVSCVVLVKVWLQLSRWLLHV